MDPFIKKFVIDSKDQLVMNNKKKFNNNQIDSTLKGKSFNNGLYRIMSNKQVTLFTDLLKDTYKDYPYDFEIFGYDWLGRIFGYVKTTNQNLMFEIGTGQILEMNDINITDFHNKILVNHSEDVLAENYYEKWYLSSNQRPSFNECIGFRTPLFLGGKDEISNLYKTNLEVYIDITLQIFKNIK